MAKSVGIEFLDHYVRLLVLETTGKNLTLVEFAEEPIVEDPESDRATQVTRALQQVFQTTKAPKNRVAVSINSALAILREMTVPFKELDQVRAVVPNELESLIHNYAIEDLIVDFIKIGETEKGSQILGVAVPKQEIKEKLDQLQEAGVDPVAIDLDVSALFNAFHATGAIQSETPFLILHGTPRFSKLIFVEKGIPQSIRTIRFSLPSPKGKEPPPEETPASPPIVVLSKEEASTFSELDSDEKNFLIQILSKEISRFLLANAAGTDPSHIILSGDFEHEEAATLLENATETPTKICPLLDSVEHSFSADPTEVQNKIGIPLGLALKASEQDALGMDFRKEEFSYKRKFDAVKTTALVTIELVIVFLAALALHFYFRTDDIVRGDLIKLYDEQAGIYRLVLNNEPSSLEKTFPEFQDKLKELQSKLGETSDFPLPHTGLEITAKLFTALQQLQNRYGAEGGDEPLWIQMDTVNVKQDIRPGNENIALTLMGKARNHTYAQRLREEIRKIDLFSNAEWEGRLQAVPEGVSFTLKSSSRNK